MSTRFSTLFALLPVTLLLGCPTGVLLLGEDVVIGGGGGGGGNDCLDVDGDGVTTCDDDCDDADPNNFPGNEEVCDLADNDCDGEADPGPVDFVAKGLLENEVLIWHLVDGGLEGPTEVSPAGVGISYAPVAGDFNNDGMLDLIVQRFEEFPAPESIVIDMYEGRCGGELEQVESPRGLDVRGAVDIHTASDVDGNGTVDVIGWDYSSGEGYTWLGAGDGTFDEQRGGFELRWWGPNDGNRREFVAMPPADGNDDGIVDLFECTNLAGAQTRCEYSVGDGEGGFEPVVDWLMDALMNGGAFADFDGDGDVDIVGGLDDDGDSGQAWIWILEEGEIVGGGEAFDVNPAEENSQNEAGYGWMYPLDVDADGDLDLITVTMNPFLEGPMDLHLVRNDGSGSFDTPELFGSSVHPLVDFSMWVQDEIAVPVHAFAAE